MDDILASVNLGQGRSIHVATLSRETIVEAGVDHLGFNGYFLFEADDSPENKGINVLGKTCSLEAAFRLIDIWELRPNGLRQKKCALPTATGTPISPPCADASSKRALRINSR